MNDLENRLRDAFAARAEQVTLESLRRESPPPAPVRRLPRWIVPGVTGLAVAATAAGVLVATSPARQAAQPSSSPASPSLVPTQTPSPASAAPAPSPSAVAPSSVAPDAQRVAVPPLVQDLRGAGWRVRVPSTWAAGGGPPATNADALCVGTREQPCLLRLVAGLDAGAPPDPRVLGAGLLPGFGRTCQQAGDASELPVGTSSGKILLWTCGKERYEQVVVHQDLLVVVAHTSADPAVAAVVRTLELDTAYTRSYEALTCADVPFAADSDSQATSVRTAGVNCPAAAGLVRRLRPQVDVASGPSRVRLPGWDCRVAREDDGLPVAAVTCTGPGGRQLAFRLS